MNGDLIGVNTSILTRSGGSNGIGFRDPANLVARFVEQARAKETSASSAPGPGSVRRRSMQRWPRHSAWVCRRVW
jgi:S1-C subfamily serine protease